MLNIKPVNKILIVIYSINIFVIHIGTVNGIVGGYEVSEDGRSKYQISVQVNGKHSCSGVVIGKQHALTVAHCFVGDNRIFFNQVYSVVGGTNNLRNTNHPYKVVVGVEKIYVPKIYGTIQSNPPIFRFIGDIAVIKLKKKLVLQDKHGVTAANLPPIANTYSNYVNANAFVSGFGTDKIILHKNAAGVLLGVIVSKDDCHKLKFAETTVISNDKSKTMFFKPLHSTHLLAQVKQRNPKNPEGVCVGDSGGPLVLPDNTLIGILQSGSPRCNEMNHAGIYTRVTEFLPFIHAALKNERSNDIRVATYDLNNNNNLIEITN